MIKTNKAFGKVAGWIPLFKIGGTSSKVKVTYNKYEEINIIENVTFEETLKKRGKFFLFAPFGFCTLLIIKSMH